MEQFAAITVYGPLGFGCLAFAWAFWAERKAHMETQAKRLEDIMKYATESREDALRTQAQMTDNIRTLDRAVTVIEAANG